MYIFNNGKFSVSFNTLKYKLSICPKETDSQFTSRDLTFYAYMCIHIYEWI